MHAPAPSTLAVIGLLPLLVWRVYIRFRRMVGRQRLSQRRPWITLGIFSTVIVLLAFFGRTHLDRLWWLGAGMTAGLMLAAYGLRITRFEPTPQGLFYTPNAYLGIAMSLLFLGRMTYRLVEVYALSTSASHQPPDFMRSPLTLAVFGLIAGYYMTYALGLVRWRNLVLRAGGQGEALAEES